MITKKKLRADLIKLFEKKPEIRQDGRLIAHLVNELRIERDQMRLAGGHVMAILDELADQDYLRLFKSGSVYNGYEIIVNKTTTDDVALEPDQGLDTSRIAAVINDTHSSRKEDTVPQPTPLDIPRHELLTLALAALQEQADEKGNVYVASCVTLIMDALGIEKRLAADLNRKLFELGLRTSPRGRNDQGKNPHWVCLETSKVTVDMLRTRPESPADESVQVTEETLENSPLASLLEIIADLEKKLSESNQVGGKLLEENTELKSKNATLLQDQRAMAETLRAANDALEAKNQEVLALNEQLVASRASRIAEAGLKDRVAEVMQRYGK